ADAADRLDVVPPAAERSGGRAVGAVQVVGLDDCHGVSLATAETATSGRFDAEDVPGREVDAGLCGELLTVEEISSAGAGLAAPRAGRRVFAALAQDRGSAVLERLELAGDAIAPPL